MSMATEKNSALNLRSDKLRLHGWTMGLILLAASLLVASSVTAVINFILIAIPVLTVAALVAMMFMGIPMVAAGIEAGRMARVAAPSQSPMLLGRNGFWKHPHGWRKGYHPHYLAFQPLDHTLVIHLDAESDEPMITRGSPAYQTRGLEHTLEGFSSRYY